VILAPSSSSEVLSSPSLGQTQYTHRGSTLSIVSDDDIKALEDSQAIPEETEEETRKASEPVILPTVAATDASTKVHPEETISEETEPTKSENEAISEEPKIDTLKEPSVISSPTTSEPAGKNIIPALVAATATTGVASIPAVEDKKDVNPAKSIASSEIEKNEVKKEDTKIGTKESSTSLVSTESSHNGAVLATASPEQIKAAEAELTIPEDSETESEQAESNTSKAAEVSKILPSIEKAESNASVETTESTHRGSVVVPASPEQIQRVEKDLAIPEASEKEEKSAETT
jgi:hypothetical protein